MRAAVRRCAPAAHRCAAALSLESGRACLRRGQSIAKALEAVRSVHEGSRGALDLVQEESGPRQDRPCEIEHGEAALDRHTEEHGC